MLGTVAAVAWTTRTSQDPMRRVLGAVCLGTVVSVVLLDVTSEYLTFTAVSQEFWMLAGLLAGAVLAARPAPAFVEAGRRPPPPWARPVAAVRRLLPEPALVRSSLGVLASFGLARL